MMYWPEMSEADEAAVRVFIAECTNIVREEMRLVKVYALANMIYGRMTHEIAFTVAILTVLMEDAEMLNKFHNLRDRAVANVITMPHTDVRGEA